MTDVRAFNLSNAHGISEPLYLRDADKFEKELATSNEAPTDDKSEDTPNENPTPDEPDNHNWKKRYSDLKSYTDKQINKLNEQFGSIQEQLRAREQENKALKSKEKYLVSDEELAAFDEQFSDFDKINRTKMQKMLDEALSDFREENKALKEEIAMLKQDKGWSELLTYHPDAKDVGESVEFKAWLDDQEVEIQALASSPIPKKIAKLISLYKRDMGIDKKAVKEKQASEAVTLRSQPEMTKGKKIWRDSEVHKMTPSQYARYAEEIDAAEREGRYEYDLQY